MVGSAIGSVIGTGIGGLIGGAFDHATTRTADSMNTLAKTVDRVTASITNIPAFFKVQNYRFEAAPTLYVPPAPPSSPTTGAPGSAPGAPNDPNNPTPNPGGIVPVNPNATVVHIAGDLVLNGVHDMKELARQLSYQNLKNKGTGNASRLSFAGGF